MILDSLSVGPFQANCYILGWPETREALVIDPGDEADRIIEHLDRQRLQPVVYLHTHGHIDHVGGTAALKKRFGGRILLHQADLFLYEHAPEHALAFGVSLAAPLPADGFVKAGDLIAWGAARGEILHTPGHSPGGVCLRVPARWMAGNPRVENADWVFTGDTLFAGSIGRTDLPGGSYAQLLRSIRTHLLTLAAETIVAPGHGPLSTIGDEKEGNPFLQGT